MTLYNLPDDLAWLTASNWTDELRANYGGRNQAFGDRLLQDAAALDHRASASPLSVADIAQLQQTIVDRDKTIADLHDTAILELTALATARQDLADLQADLAQNYVLRADIDRDYVLRADLEREYFRRPEPRASFREHLKAVLAAAGLTIEDAGRESSGTLPHVTVEWAGIDPHQRRYMLVNCRAALSSAQDPDADIEDYADLVMEALLADNRTVPKAAWRTYAAPPSTQQRTKAQTQNKKVLKPAVLSAIIPVEEA